MVLPSVDKMLGWMLVTEKENKPGCGDTPSAFTADLVTFVFNVAS